MYMGKCVWNSMVHVRVCSSRLQVLAEMVVYNYIQTTLHNWIVLQHKCLHIGQIHAQQATTYSGPNAIPRMAVRKWDSD